jgi:ABC-type dipeptide/oligopeptide/nickel transport system permease subunit
MPSLEQVARVTAAIMMVSRLRFLSLSADAASLGKMLMVVGDEVGAVVEVSADVDVVAS